MSDMADQNENSDGQPRAKKLQVPQSLREDEKSLDLEDEGFYDTIKRKKGRTRDRVQPFMANTKTYKAVGDRYIATLEQISKAPDDKVWAWADPDVLRFLVSENWRIHGRRSLPPTLQILMYMATEALITRYGKDFIDHVEYDTMDDLVARDTKIGEGFPNHRPRPSRSQEEFDDKKEARKTNHIAWMKEHIDDINPTEIFESLRELVGNLIDNASSIYDVLMDPKLKLENSSILLGGNELASSVTLYERHKSLVGEWPKSEKVINAQNQAARQKPAEATNTRKRKFTA